MGNGCVCVFLTSVIKRNNVVEMHVDTEGDHKIGPSSSSSTLTKDPLYVGGIPGRYSGGEDTGFTTTFNLFQTWSPL